MAIVCPECEKRMPTQKVLDGHLVKAHGASKEVSAEEAQMDNVDTQASEEVSENENSDTPQVQTPDDVVKDPINDNYVEIRSADGRSLEVAINGVMYNDKTIRVPREQEGDIRRILNDGGFYLKD